MNRMFLFSKYEGAGNDFILTDEPCSLDAALISKLCHRKFGIGADGLILIQPDLSADYRMRIFNCDGSEAESCGNGLRCVLQFLRDRGDLRSYFRIAAADRTIHGEWKNGHPCVDLGEPRDFKVHELESSHLFYLDTGVPHAVLFVADASHVPVLQAAPFFRRHPLFAPRGANVNFASLHSDGSVSVRTFERGIEGEVLACGTGAAAVGYVAHRLFSLPSPIQIRCPGGTLQIYIENNSLKLAGPATKVFDGSICTK